ncbi:uncharacterized protein LOC125185176 [Salvia hispanica]|uniref:uncharacterized protein LOC125185176 n=1 Tax=Salvia hispanica TaxID=49212 RepID=UPI002008F568|nr:uncharacterized protein LOC125185176 [Salvia hispanica]
MGFDFEERKTLLYADLFKLQETRESIMPQWRSLSPSPSPSSSASDIDDEADFAAELSRQMAECMLQEEEAEVHTTKLKDQSGVGDHIGVSRGRRVKGAELTRKPELNYGRYRDGRWRSGSGTKGHSGSGMQAIFLGGPGSRNAPSGTGVFLPRVTNNSVHQNKKSGLSTVLIPTRVLEALKLHFARFTDSTTPPSTSAFSCHSSLRDEKMRSEGQGNNHTKYEVEPPNKIDAMQVLPQEWTY